MGHFPGAFYSILWVPLLTYFHQCQDVHFIFKSVKSFPFLPSFPIISILFPTSFSNILLIITISSFMFWSDFPHWPTSSWQAILLVTLFPDSLLSFLSVGHCCWCYSVQSLYLGQSSRTGSFPTIFVQAFFDRLWCLGKALKCLSLMMTDCSTTHVLKYYFLLSVTLLLWLSKLSASVDIAVFYHQSHQLKLAVNQ